MTENELIYQQALKIAQLEERLMFHEVAEKNIHSIIYCIGGPLNDNKLGYSRVQMSNFKYIADSLVSIP